MDTRIRNLMTCNRLHRPKVDIDILYVPRSQVGRGMIQLERSLKTTTIGIQKYLETTKDWMLHLVHIHEQSKNHHSIRKESTKFATELNIETATGA